MRVCCFTANFIRYNNEVDRIGTKRTAYWQLASDLGEKAGPYKCFRFCFFSLRCVTLYNTMSETYIYAQFMSIDIRGDTELNKFL